LRQTAGISDNQPKHTQNMNEKNPKHTVTRQVKPCPRARLHFHHIGETFPRARLHFHHIGETFPKARLHFHHIGETLPEGSLPFSPNIDKNIKNHIVFSLLM
jgi:hypothetical protein